jgi:DNA-binding NtrC family response regulator
MTTAPSVRVFIAEDEQPLARLFADHLTGCGHSVRVAHDGRAALEALTEESYDVALLDVVMPELNGLEVLRVVRAQPNAPEVIIVTGNATMETALSAVRLGAYDVLAKPCRLAELEVIVRRAAERRALGRANAALQARLSRDVVAGELVAAHPRMREVLDLVERVAPTDTPVLIVGESGTGKELIARAVHARSNVAAGPFVDINCAAIGGAHVEYELFGYETGTVPGAADSRTGTLEMAAGGSLFLDEVSALDPRLQAALSRVIEERRFVRAGGTQKVLLNARLIASSNRDLAKLVASGGFRDDLFFRINAFTITVPPLRDRVDDIPLLAGHFLQRFGGGSAPALAADAVDALCRYPWPGNVRELRNLMERAVLLAEGGTIRAADLPLAMGNGADGAADASVLRPLDEVERDHIRRVLNGVGWHQGRAASILGISSKTLYRKIREYGFTKPA